MSAIDFRNNINWTRTTFESAPIEAPQKPNTRTPEEIVALMRQQALANNSLTESIVVRLATQEERAQLMQQMESNRPASAPNYYTRVIDDNLAVRKDKLSSHSADELNERTSMVSVSGSYNETELTAMMDATAAQRPDIAGIIEMMQPLQNGERSSVFSSRVNVGLPNVTEKVLSVDTLEAVYSMSYRLGGTHTTNIYQANMELKITTEDNTEITINAELMNKLVMDEDYVMLNHPSGKPYMLVGAARDLNLSFSANQELTEKDKELMNNIGDVVGNLLNNFYQNLSVGSTDTQALLSLQGKGAENIELNLSTNDMAYYYLSDEYFNGMEDKIYFNLSKNGEGVTSTASNSHKTNPQTIKKMQDASKNFF
ncbi:MAG: hypothetical protein WAO12_09990 [Venatoribacter sp.]